MAPLLLVAFARPSARSSSQLFLCVGKVTLGRLKTEGLLNGRFWPFSHSLGPKLERSTVNRASRIRVSPVPAAISQVLKRKHHKECGDCYQKIASALKFVAVPPESRVSCMVMKKSQRLRTAASRAASSK